MSTTEKIKIAPEHSFRAPDGSDVPVRSLRLEVDYDDETVREIRTGFWVDHATWERIDAGGWFNMPAEVRGATFAGGFEPGANIEIEAELDGDATTAVALTSDDYWDIGAQLHGAKGDAPLNKTESWFGLYVKQVRGPIKTGFATTHPRLVHKAE